MPQFSVFERIWLTTEYHKSVGLGRAGSPSVVRVQRDFQTVFHKKPPTRKNLLSMVAKFRRTGSVMNQNKAHSWRPRTARTNTNAGRVMDKALNSPKKSIRRMSRELNISKTGVHLLLHELGCFSYRIQIFQKLTLNDFAERARFCAHTLAN